jgi:hypothetical protein
MNMGEDDVHRTETEARAGSSPHVVRYILAISLALLVLAYVVILYVW